MHMTLALLAALSVPATSQDLVNLCLQTSGGMPTALASVDNFTFSPGKTTDGKPSTAWVSEKGTFPVWLRVEWRVPVEVREIALNQFPECPFDAVGPVGEYAIEALRGDAWVEIATGNAEDAGVDSEQVHALDEPIHTTAIRLVVRSAPTGQFSISEIEVRGPETVLPIELAPKWQARWIWPEPSLYIPNREPSRRYFRRSFEIADPSEIAEAWLLACAFDRLNEFWVNNRPALRHGSLHGGSLREAEVREIPVEWLVEGENVLAASADDVYEVGSHGLLAELIIVRQDGARELIVTDDQWTGQQDQGIVPDWRKAGFSDTRWIACRIMQWPNTRWHWSWNVPYPNVAPEGRVTVTALSVTPTPVKPGETVEIAATIQCDGPLSRDYALVVRLGETSLWRDHDYELWGAHLAEDVLKTSEWQAGAHEVLISVPVPDYAPRQTAATLLLSTPKGGAELAAPDGATTDRYGLHFSIGVDRGATVAGGEGFPECDVRTRAGTPTLHIDNQPTAPILWSSSYGNLQRYNDYAATGVKLFRPVIDGSPIPAPSEADGYFEWWLARVDTMMENAVGIDPEIRLMPAVWMDPNPQWLFDNPSEQTRGGRGNLVIPLALTVPDRGQVRPTFMSQSWRRAGAEGLKRLVEHMKGQTYAQNIIGVCLFAGRAGENYWGGNEFNLLINEAGQYDAKPKDEWDAGDLSMAARRTWREWLIGKYGTDEALQQAWRQDDITFDAVLEPAKLDANTVCDAITGTGRPEDAGSVLDSTRAGVGAMPIDYYQCYSEAMIDTFAAWGRGVKEASDGRLLTGCYYGYAISQLYTSVPGFHGHTAVAKACRTKDLDFYVSPSEYNQARRPGGPFWGLNIIDSMRLHGKLWIYEQDTRTYLAEHMPKTFNRRNTIEVLKRDCAAAITHGTGWWWYEFAQGQGGARAREWFRDPEFAKFATKIKGVYEEAQASPERSPSSEIAVFYHGNTLTAQDIFAPTAQINIAIGRLTLVDSMQRIGAPHDAYNLEDIPVLAGRGMLDQYRMLVFLNPFYLGDEERGWLDLCKGGDRTLVWLWAPGLAGPGLPPSPDRVAEVTGISGVSWDRRRAVQSYEITGDHAITQGLANLRLTALGFPPGATWERFGNEVWPVVYVDADETDATVLGHWVIDDEVQPRMGALCVRDVGEWRSVYAPVPYLNSDLLRNIARWSGAHIYREGSEVLFANREYVALHTGAEPATGELKLPAEATVFDVFAEQTVAQDTDTITLDVPPKSTVLYRLTSP